MIAAIGDDDDDDDGDDDAVEDDAAYGDDDDIHGVELIGEFGKKVVRRAKGSEATSLHQPPG